MKRRWSGEGSCIGSGLGRKEGRGVSGRGGGGWPILDPCWSDSFKSLPTVTEKRGRAAISVFPDQTAHGSLDLITNF